MKVLNGIELAGYIKERQAKQVRNLRQGYGVYPKLAIIRTTDNPIILTYVHKKQQYGEDILVAVEDHRLSNEDEALVRIRELNDDVSVQGIIVQLPLSDSSRTDELVNAVAPGKDVDAL
jgi:methylenetetrahydrofolate dehydrogenase (NADP+)/methenyltetrahydrofolate cyclohydrolase